MKIYEDKTLIFPFVDNATEQRGGDYCIVIEKGRFTLVDGRRMTLLELKSLVKALNEAVLRAGG